MLARGRARRCPNVSVDSLPRAARRLLPGARHRRDRQGPARGQRLRLRAADGADELPARRHRDGVRADQPGVLASSSSSLVKEVATFGGDVVRPGPGRRARPPRERLERTEQARASTARPAPTRRHRRVDVHDKLDELAAVVENARSMPMSASCVVNRAEVLDLLDELRGAAARRARRTPTASLADREDVVAGGRARGRADHRRGADAERGRLVSEHRGLPRRRSARPARIRPRPPSRGAPDAAARPTTTSTPSWPTSRSRCTRRSPRSRSGRRASSSSRYVDDDDLDEVQRRPDPDDRPASVRRRRRVGTWAAGIRGAAPAVR